MKLVEQGNIGSQQFLDLLPQSYPAIDQPDVESAPEGQPPKDESAPVVAPNTVKQPELNADARSPAPEAFPDINSLQDVAVPETSPEAPTVSSSTSGETPVTNPGDSTYGPIRRRVTQKDGPMSFWRPAAMRQDDFVEIMKEIVPPLVEKSIETSESDTSDQEMHDAEAGEPAPARPRT